MRKCKKTSLKAHKYTFFFLLLSLDEKDNVVYFAVLHSKSMSDGNFNRQLLPPNSYRSGLQVGRQQMRQKVMDILPEILKGSGIGDAECDKILKEVRSRL